MLAKVLRKLFTSKPQQTSDRSNGSGERPSPKSLTPDLLKMLEKGDEDALRYPPYIRGFPAFISGSVLLDYHKDKVGLIASGIGLPPKQFNQLILPVLNSYADFVHLVPASQNHHHRAWGGLLAHGLEVALMALNSCQTTSFDHGRVPQDRTRRKERWYAAAVFASLLHDTGKPLSDFRITDETGVITWKPVSKSIPEWAREIGIERYYLHWNPGRHERHKNLSITMVDRILHPEVREWLMDGGQDLYSAMVAAITGEDEKSILTGIVIKSDSQSVSQDLKKHGGDPAGAAAGGTGVPIASQVINAMRLLRQNETWKANEKGARIWSTTQGIFVAWNAAASEVVEKMLADGLKAFPRSADSLGEILTDHDVFERNPNGSIYWKVAPDILSAGKEKVLRLQCVKLSSPSTLYPFDPAPPPIAVEIGDDKSSIRYDPAHGAMGLAVGEASDGGDIDLEANGLGGISAADNKPMFDLEGDEPKPSPAVPSGFSAPALATKPASAGATKPGKQGKQGSMPTLQTNQVAPAKPSLVIGAPPPAFVKEPAAVGATPQKTTQPPAGLFSGLKIGADAPSFEEEPRSSQPAEPAAWEDPFASTEMQLDGDPFASAPTSPKADSRKLPTVEPLQLKAAAPQKRTPAPGNKPSEVLNDRVGLPGLQIGEKPPLAKSQPADKAIESPVVVADAAPVSANAFMTVEITGDFDAEILEMTGIEQAFADVPVKAPQDPIAEHSSNVPTSVMVETKPALQRAPVVVAKPAPARREGFVPIPPDAFEDEFRFDAEQVLDGFDVPAPPIKNPIGVSAPADMVGLDLSSFSLQEAPQRVSLDGFDAPMLEAAIFIGGTPAQPIIQAGAVEDLEFDDGRAGDSEDQVIDHDLGTEPSAAEDHAPASKKRRRKKKKKDGFVVPMPQMELDTASQLSPIPGLHIGPAREPKSAPQREPVQSSPRPLPPAVTAAPAAEMKAPDAEQRSTYQTFLNRHPELATKFLWYADNVDSAIRLYKRHHPLFLFKDGGFQPEDVTALNEAHWLWFDLTSPERLVYSMLGDKGVVLISYLVDALAEFSNGLFSVSVSRPATSLTDAEMARTARAAIERLPVNSETYAVPVVVFTPKLISAIANDLGIREPDLIRALIETQQVVMERKNYVVRVEAMPVSYE